MTPLLVDSALPEGLRTRSGEANGIVDRRAEPRLIPHEAIPAHVRIGDDAESAAAHILDISPSGVRLGMESSPDVGSLATIWFHHTIATGQIRYCRGVGDGSFEVGLRLLDVLNKN